jgi:hypothetical protein
MGPRESAEFPTGVKEALAMCAPQAHQAMTLASACLKVYPDLR